ncbi:poly(A) polymerase [Sulfurifustis variabilis]|uniref:Poly(A) polymerase I n=1 Tax=Sulfurifustis variabilis TaxID=1675686 RepID=A0A1B4V7S3_9GAMM|nr:poly(A) polymerase [Sulfurifustis variabilis]
MRFAESRGAKEEEARRFFGYDGMGRIDSARCRDGIMAGPSVRRARSNTAQGKAKISEPFIIPRAEHPISRALISENALKVLNRLKEAGYASLLVGGCVRDLMLGREPKDFDVVTDARPEEIRKLFGNARLIGRRFRLAHVRFGREIVEVATFRAAPPPGLEGESAETHDHNVFGTREEDARRRDFTVNALYYDIRDFSVIDYVGGVADLKKGVLRMIGDPVTRYREDPVRMLRAIRFAAKLGFRLEDRTGAPIRDLGPLLLNVPPARMFEEVLKLFQGGYAVETYELMRTHGLFGFLFPLTERSLEVEEQHFPLTLVPKALANTDARVAEDKPVTPAFLFAALLWEPVRQETATLASRGMRSNEALERAAERVLREQLKHVTIPKRFSAPMREIWSMQSRFERRSGNQPFRLLEHKRFRAAYDFLVLRADCGEADPALASWWTRFQERDEAGRREMIAEAGTAPSPGKRRRRRRGRRRPPEARTTPQ